MSLSRCWHELWARVTNPFSGGRPNRRPPRARLTVERLDDRIVPATVYWDGGGLDPDWNNPRNWSGDRLPGRADDVVIDVPGQDATIVHASGRASVHSLDCKERLAIFGSGSFSIVTSPHVPDKASKIAALSISQASF